MQVQFKISEEWIGQPKQQGAFKSEDIIPYLHGFQILMGGDADGMCKSQIPLPGKKYDEALTLLNGDKGSNPYFISMNIFAA